MKKLLLLTLSLFCLNLLSNAQQIPTNEKTGKAEYVDVPQVTGVSDSLLHDRAVKWIHSYYNNPYKVIVSNDTNKFEIMGKARFRLTLKDKDGNETPSGFVAYNFKMNFKDGRYRYEFYKIRWQQTSYFDVSRWEDKDDPKYQAEVFPQYIEQTVKYFDDLLEAMEEAIATPEEGPAEAW